MLEQPASQTLEIKSQWWDLSMDIQLAIKNRKRDWRHRSIALENPTHPIMRSNEKD